MPVVQIQDIGSVGLVLDQPPHELPPNAFTAAQNIRFVNTNALRVKGEQSVLETPAFTPYSLGYYRTNANRYLVYAGVDSIAADDGTGASDITGSATFTGTATDRWCLNAFNGWMIANNGVDVPVAWSGTGDVAALTNWDSDWSCQALRPFKNFLFALNVTKSSTALPHMVKWSDAAIPGSLPYWDETNPALLAGEIELSDEPSPLVDMLPLGDTALIYKESSIWAATFIGGIYVWQFRRIPGEMGMVARGCGAATPLGHVVLSAGDLILCDGQSIRSLLTGRMREWLFGQIDATNFGQSFLTVNQQLNEVWVCFPETGASVCTKALIWNWVNDVFSVRDLADVTAGCQAIFEVRDATDLWSGHSETWESSTLQWGGTSVPKSNTNLFLATSAPSVVKVDAGNDFSGTNFTATLERTGLDFGDKDAVKMVRALYPRVQGQAGKTIYVQFGATMDPEGSYSWSNPIPYVIGSTFKANGFASGRLLGYRIYSTDAFPWQLASVDLDVVQQGRY